MKKKVISLLLCAALTLGLLAGCGSTPAQEEQQQVTEENVDTENVPEAPQEEENAKEAGIVQNIEVVGVESLKEVVDYLTGKKQIESKKTDLDSVFNSGLKYNMDFKEMQYWYNGYLFDEDLHVYNPESVVTAIMRKKFKSYWTRTETYEALKIYIDMNFDGLKDNIIKMLAGSRIKISIDTFQNDMTTFASKDDVLTLLVHLGYLAYDYNLNEVFIPNHEIQEEFTTATKISNWNEIVKSITLSDKLLEATIAFENETVAQIIDEIHMATASVLQYNNENSLACVISLAYYSARKDYIMHREFPTGKGFADLVFIPRRNTENPVIIVELKWNHSAEGAIKQIKDKNYTETLKDYSGQIILAGINYNKKTKKHECIIENDNK